MQYGPKRTSHFLTIWLNKDDNRKRTPVGVFQFCFLFFFNQPRDEDGAEVCIMWDWGVVWCGGTYYTGGLPFGVVSVSKSCCKITVQSQSAQYLNPRLRTFLQSIFFSNLNYRVMSCLFPHPGRQAVFGS